MADKDDNIGEDNAIAQVMQEAGIQCMSINNTNESHNSFQWLTPIILEGKYCDRVKLVAKVDTINQPNTVPRGPLLPALIYSTLMPISIPVDISHSTMIQALFLAVTPSRLSSRLCLGLKL